MASEPRDHDPVLASDSETVLGCTGCAWRPTFTARDLRSSREQFDTHIPDPKKVVRDSDR